MKYINKTIIHFILIGIAVFGLYWQTTDFEFVLDDTIVIKENNFVKKGISGIPEILGNDSMTGFIGKQPDLLAGGRYRPLSLVVFALGYQVFGLNPFYFHLMNILFYLAGIFVLYYTLLRLFRFFEKQTIKLFLFVATLLFAIHPIHTEAVANIKGLDEILAFLFGTAAFLFLLIYFDTKKIIHAIFGSFFLILAFLAKESALPLIVAIPVSLYFFRNTSLKIVFRYFLILLIPTVIYLLIRNNALVFLLNNDVNVTGIMNNPYLDASISQNAGTILFTLLLYLKLLVFPHPLTHDYYPYHIKLIELYHPFSLLAGMLIVFLMWIALKGIKKRDVFSYILFFFFITISIVSNVLINVGAFMNERFLFIPSFAFSLLVVALFVKFYPNKKARPILLIIASIMLVGFVYRSVVRIPDWKNEKRLNFSAVQVSKNSTRANCFYAVTLYNEILKDSIQDVKMTKIPEAQKYIEKSLAIYPEYVEALKIKAGLAAEIYKIDKSADKLLDVFKSILEVRHIVYVDEFTNWLEVRTDKNKMADYYFEVGYKNFAVQKRNFNLATSYLQKGYKIKSDHAGILFGNCIVSFLTANYAKSIEYGNNYIQKFGESAEMLFYVGNSQLKSGNQQLGMENIEKAYRLKPELKNQKLL